MLRTLRLVTPENESETEVVDDEDSQNDESPIAIEPLPAPTIVQTPPLQMSIQEFVMLNGNFNRNIRVFASPNAMKLYKEFHHYNRFHRKFQYAKQCQENTIGLPLLFSRRTISLGIGDITYLKLYECMPVPLNKKRLYSSMDNVLTGEVLRRKFVSYFRYRVFVRGLETVVIAHTRLPIVDFNIGKERYRFLRGRVIPNKRDQFRYDLYLLDPDMISLVDGMDESRRVQKRNPLISMLMMRILLSWRRGVRATFASSIKMGQFDFFQLWEVFTRTRQTASFLKFTVAGEKKDANSAVEYKDLVMVAITMVLKSIQEDQKATRTRETGQTLGLNELRKGPPKPPVFKAGILER